MIYNEKSWNTLRLFPPLSPSLSCAWAVIARSWSEARVSLRRRVSDGSERTALAQSQNLDYVLHIKDLFITTVGVLFLSLFSHFYDIFSCGKSDPASVLTSPLVTHLAAAGIPFSAPGQLLVVSLLLAAVGHMESLVWSSGKPCQRIMPPSDDVALAWTRWQPRRLRCRMVPSVRSRCCRRALSSKRQYRCLANANLRGTAVYTQQEASFSHTDHHQREGGYHHQHHHQGNEVTTTLVHNVERRNVRG